MVMVNPNFGALPNRLPSPSDQEPKKMLTVSVLPDGRTLVEINNSSLSYLLSCGRKSWYALERKLVSEGGSPALVFGTAIHAAMEIFYREPRTNRSIPPGFAEICEELSVGALTLNDPTIPDHFLFEAMRAFWAKSEPLMLLPLSDKRSQGNGIWTLKHYFETYINDQYEVYSDKSGPMVERLEYLDIYSDDKLVIRLFGTIDVVLKDSSTGQIMPADHKTSSQLGSDFYNRLKPNHQYTGYMLLAREKLGLDTNFFLVNALQVKERPKTSRGTPPNFARQITTRDDQDFHEFKLTVVDAVKRYLTWKSEGFWPMGQVNECASFGGCQYLDICAAPNAIRENIIEAKYGKKLEE